MKYVYILQCITEPDRYYTGITDDLKNQLARHNTGQVPHTSKFRPWRLNTYVAHMLPFPINGARLILKNI